MEEKNKLDLFVYNLRNNMNIKELRQIINGEILIRLTNNSKKTVTSKNEFLKAVKVYSDSEAELIVKQIKQNVKAEVTKIPDQDLFDALNKISYLSDQDLYDWLNIWSPLKFANKYTGNSEFSNINQLILKIATIKDDDTILDPTSGSVGAWTQILKNNPDQSIILQEINSESAQLAYLNSKLLKAENCKVYNADVLDNPEYIESDHLKLFDKVITFPPISMKTNVKAIEQNSYNRFRFGKIPVSRADYAFISNAIASLNEKGKAVILVADGPLFQSSMVAKIRQNLVDNDLIEAVISLPDKLLLGTTIPTNLLVINKDKMNFKNKILFIDGNQKDWYVRNRLTNCLTDDAINKIFDIYNNKIEEEGISKVITNSEYQGSLSVKKYVLPSSVEIAGTSYHVNRNNLDSQETIKLGDLVEITRGYNVSRKNEDTNGEFLSIKVTDISDNHKIAVDNLTKINIPTKPDRYLVMNNDVLLSTRGTLGKVAYVDNASSNMAANANMVILRATTDKINMKWLMLYLASPMGQFLISEIASGTTISTLSPRELKEIKVPVISKETQDQAVEKYEQQKKTLDKKKQELLKQYKENDSTLFNSWNMDKVLIKKAGN